MLLAAALFALENVFVPGGFGDRSSVSPLSLLCRFGQHHSEEDNMHVKSKAFRERSRSNLDKTSELVGA